MASTSTDKMAGVGRSWLTVPAQVAVVLLWIPLLLLWVLLWLAAYVVVGVFLHLVIWVWWCARGRHVLFVYSDSPKWRDYIDREMLPRLPQSTTTLNWSQRRQWRWNSLAVLAFNYLGGWEEYNPMVIVFRPFRPTRIFRFYKAFNDYKHGNPRALDQLRGELFEFLEQTGIGSVS